MGKTLFVTYEKIDSTPVARAMFYDIYEILKREKLDVDFFGGFSDNRNGGYIPSRFIIVNLFKFIYALFKANNRVNYNTFVCRSYPSLLVVKLINFGRHPRLIFDTRGLWFDELIDSGKIPSVKYFLFILRFIEKTLLNWSSVVIVVSEAQKKYYMKAHKLSLDRIKVVYNGAPRQSTIVTYQSERRCIGYVGSLGKWHCPEIMREIVSRMPDTDFVFITKDETRYREYFEDLDNTIRLEQNYRSIPVKFDLGLCLINDSISKSICFPVKFSEYLSSNTPVCFSQNVEELYTIWKKNPKIGTPVDLTRSPQQIVSDIKKFFERNVESDEELLSQELDFNTQISAYREIIGSWLT